MSAGTVVDLESRRKAQQAKKAPAAALPLTYLLGLPQVQEELRKAYLGHVADWREALACVGAEQVGPAIGLCEGSPDDPGPPVAYVLYLG